MNINKRIKERRQALGLSVEDIAASIHKDRATVYRYESSAIEKMPVSIIEPLAKALACTPAYLMGWDANPGSDLCGENLDIVTEDEQEELTLYRQLDEGDKGEIRGTMKQMLKANKYISKAEGSTGVI